MILYIPTIDKLLLLRDLFFWMKNLQLLNIRVYTRMYAPILVRMHEERLKI